MPSKSVIIAVLLSMVMVMAAGCAGWGTDGPTDPEEETDSNGEAQADEESENEESDRAEGEGTDTSDDTSSTSEGDTGAQDSSESSDTTSDTSQSDGSDSDESTDETGATGNGDPQTDSDSSEDDSEDTGAAPASSDSDESDSDSLDESNGEGSPDENDSSSDESKTYELTATIVGPDGRPVEGMEVGLYTYNEGEFVTSATTDVNGQVTFEVEKGDYELNPDVEASPYTDHGTHLVAVSDDTEYEIGLVHPPDGGEENTHTLTVQVYDSEGEPVEGADVSLTVYDTGESVDEGVTDSSGEAQFTVPDGSYEVTVSGVEEAQSTPDMGTSVQGEDTTHTVNLYDPDDDMHLYSATIQVVDEDGNPIQNELVKVGPVDHTYEHLITDENGEVTVRFGNSSLDDAVLYEAIVRGEPYGFSVERGVQHEQIVVSDDSERETHELTVHTGEQVGVEGVDVTVERWDGATTTKTTNEDGTVTFDVYPGDYTVTGVDPRGEEQSIEVTVPDQQEVLLDDMAYPVPDEVETTLRVVDQNGDPVEGVTVTAVTSIPPHYADVYIQSGPTDENGEVVVEAHGGQSYSIDRIEDTDGNSYQVVSVGDRMTLHVNEDGELDEIVVERPTAATQRSFTVTA